MMELAISSKAAMWFLPFVVPIGLWVAYSDMKMMKIQNKAVLALGLVFVIVGLFVLDWPSYWDGWINGVVVLGIGFVIASLNLVGAGDAKFAAAMAPFVVARDFMELMILFAVIVFVAFVLHRLMRVTGIGARIAPDWQSWTDKDFPMGLALGPALIIYLIFGAAFGS